MKSEITLTSRDLKIWWSLILATGFQWMQLTFFRTTQEQKVGVISLNFIQYINIMYIV